MILEYGRTGAVIEGGGLSELFGHLLSGRVRVIRRGQHGACLISAVQIIDE
jgi:hypothetical protein